MIYAKNSKYREEWGRCWFSLAFLNVASFRATLTCSSSQIIESWMFGSCDIPQRNKWASSKTCYGFWFVNGLREQFQHNIHNSLCKRIARSAEAVANLLLPTQASLTVLIAFFPWKSRHLLDERQIDLWLSWLKYWLHSSLYMFPYFSK